MSFLSDLADSLTGQSSIKLTKDQLAAQLGFQQSILTQQLEEAKLKYNPELNAQKMKSYIVITVIVAIVIVFYIRNR